MDPDAEAAIAAALAAEAFYQSEIIGDHWDATPTSSLFPVHTEALPDNSPAFVSTEKDWNMAKYITDVLQATGPLSSLQILL